MQALEIGNIEVESGELKLGKLPCGYLPDSTEVSIPLIIANGSEPGPTLLLTAAMHGPELPGVEVIRRVMREIIDPKKLKGAIIAAPVLNPFGFRHAVMNTPQDGYNLNRVFPGDPGTLLTHRLAHIIYTQLVKKSDFYIDFHANPAPAMAFSIIKECEDQKVWQQCREMADAFGIPTVEMVLSNERHRSGTMGDCAADDGIPNLTLELLYWRQIDESAVQTGVRGTCNVMKYLGMVDGQIEKQEGVDVFDDRMTRTELTAEKGGLVQYLKDVGASITKGETIAIIRDPWGDIVDEVKSPQDGWILTWPFINFQAMTTGDILVMILFKRE